MSERSYHTAACILLSYMAVSDAAVSANKTVFGAGAAGLAR